MNNDNDTQVGYSCKDWERHYKEKDLRWDLEKVAPPLSFLWKERKIYPCKASVPGCGAGHEAIFLAEQGFQITALDYTQGAVKLLKKTLKKKTFRERCCVMIFLSWIQNMMKVLI